MQDCHICVIGAGIIGLSTAMAISQQKSGVRLFVLEKESKVAAHQSGHNSGVIHSGLYYRPGSLKARYTWEGRRALIEFCKANGIAHAICGKVVVANNPQELVRLRELERRGIANGIDGLRMLNASQLKDVEPFAQGVQALWVPTSGIVDYGVVARRYAAIVRQNGGRVLTGARLIRAVPDRKRWILHTSKGCVRAEGVINCAGLHSDRVARMFGLRSSLKIVPFRGEYHLLSRAATRRLKGLIYPVPDPRFPFLGVHLTRRIHGNAEAGPNAVLAFKREGYHKWSFSLRDVAEGLMFPGLWRLVRRHGRMAVSEYHRSLSKRAFLRALQQLMPSLTLQDLSGTGAGVRAQALAADGRLVDDFHIQHANRSIHVLNAPSPAATASIPIGRAIANEATTAFGIHP